MEAAFLADAVKALLAFFVLTFAVTWTCWFGAAQVGTSELLFLPGTIAPAAVAFALTWRADGPAGVRALFNRLIAWQVPARWYVFALSYVLVIKLVAAALHRFLLGAWPRFGEENPALVIVAIAFSTVAQAGEEAGWRGYALPRLAERLGLRWAGVILGAIWAAWHLPLFYLPGSDLAGQSFVLYSLGVITLSVAMTWLYARTGGSVFLVMVMHAAGNNTSSVVPSAVVNGAGDVFGWEFSTVGLLTAGLLWLGAAYFLLRMPRHVSQQVAGEAESFPRR